MAAFSSLDIVYMLAALFAYIYVESCCECGFLVTIALSAFVMRNVNFPIALVFLILNLIGHISGHEMLIFFSFISLCSMILFRKRKSKAEEKEVKVAVIDEVIAGKKIVGSLPGENKASKSLPSPLKSNVEVISSVMKEETVIENNGNEETITTTFTKTELTEHIPTPPEEVKTQTPETETSQSNEEYEHEDEHEQSPAKANKGGRKTTTKDKKKAAAAEEKLTVEDAIKQAQEEARLRMEERLKQLETKKPKKK